VPPEAGPQQRVGLEGQGQRFREDRPGWWVYARKALCTINAGVAQIRCKDVCQGATSSYFSKYRRTTGMGAEKFEASLGEWRWFGRHEWHPSDRAMMTRPFHLAPSIEQPGESLRDIAWRARGLAERQRGGHEGG
jgi:hypothetical protein